jgi:hypothetical protein
MIILMAATFFLPLGFDALFALTMRWTGSFWAADIIFYGISLSLFGLYFYLSKKWNIKR